MMALHGWQGYDPRNMLILPTEAVARLAATEDVTVFVTVCGKLYIGCYNGVDKGSLKQVNLKEDNVVDAVIYRYSVVFVTATGDAFTLNLKTEKVNSLLIHRPKKTCIHGKEEDGKKVNVTQIRAGQDHILFLSRNGELWVKGKGPALGCFTNKTDNEITIPVQVDFFKDRRLFNVAAGAYFTIALVEPLPPLNGIHSVKEDLPDIDSYVKVCSLCRKETGDRILFYDVDENIKCPLGLKVAEDGVKGNPASKFIYEKSLLLDDIKSPAEMCASRETSFDDLWQSISLNNKRDIDLQRQLRSSRLKSIANSEFKLLDKDNTNFYNTKSSTGNFSNTGAAEEFFLKPLSRVKSASFDNGSFRMDNFEYIHSIDKIDNASEPLGENVSNANNLTANGIEKVLDKVGELSKQFITADYSERLERNMLINDTRYSLDNLTFEPIGVKRSSSFDYHNFPRSFSGINSKKIHAFTRSGCHAPLLGKELGLVKEKSKNQLEINKKALANHGQNILNTEVWVWGACTHGQLGLGDTSHRLTPTCLTELRLTGVTKIVCGSHHAAALTVDHEIFVWGNNKDGQVGLPSPSIMNSPVMLELPNSRVAKDMDCGNNYIIVITMDGFVYYVGTQAPLNSPGITQINVCSGDIMFNSVLCQSQSIVCTTNETCSEILNFMTTEIAYLRLLKQTIKYIILPFLNNFKSEYDKSYKNGIIPKTTLAKNKRVKISFLESYLMLTYAITGCIDFINNDKRNDVTEVLPIISKAEELCSFFKEYSILMCDALAMNAFNLDSKANETIIENGRSRFKHLNILLESCKCNMNTDQRDGEKVTDKYDNNYIFYTKLVMLPFYRIYYYERFLLNLKNNTSKFYSPFSLDKIRTTYNHWKQLSISSHNLKIEAEETRLFWISNSIKMYDSLADPKRRLIRDSKRFPITLHNAGRFSSHSFILLSDLLIHNSYNSYVTYNLSTMWVESLPNSNDTQSMIQIRLPEDILVLVCPNPAEKSQWLHVLQDSIMKQVRNFMDEMCHYVPGSPPLLRKAAYTFTKNPLYKDATYSGNWLCGMMHGEGSLEWPDGKRFIGQFHRNMYQGYGRMEMCNDGDLFKGFWKDGKLDGRGVIRYGNKDLYIGYLKEGQPHGHGELKQGKWNSQAASIYTGEWKNGQKNGYGVLDEISQGEKYHGMWLNNNRHGSGMVVTMNDIYYEGNFNQNKLAGYGLMILEDGTYYNGELGPGGSCNGKGSLYYPNGDIIEGTFNGKWVDGIKIHGMLSKKTSLDSIEKLEPKSLGRYSVPANHKWISIFKACEESLGVTSGTSISVSKKIWDSLARYIESEKRVRVKANVPTENIDGLDRILDVEKLTYCIFFEIMGYLEKAFSSQLHPLGQLLQSLISAFRATYGGLVTHPRLLTYAVDEVQSFTLRLYCICRLLFPCLPHPGDNILLEGDTGLEDIIVTPSCVIHPFLLPHLYAILSPLYVRHHMQRDEDYWQRLLKWNQQSDMALMAFLGVDSKFWLSKEKDSIQLTLPSAKDENFTEAIEMLQLLSTLFTPKDKLGLILKCGNKIGQEVSTICGPSFLMSMDDLLPIFLYVVVRSRIQHLGADIGLVEDLLDPHLQNGELEHMFTTLRACYYHILHEKPTAVI